MPIFPILVVDPSKLSLKPSVFPKWQELIKLRCFFFVVKFCLTTHQSKWLIVRLSFQSIIQILSSSNKINLDLHSPHQLCLFTFREIHCQIFSTLVCWHGFVILSQFEFHFKSVWVTVIKKKARVQHTFTKFHKTDDCYHHNTQELCICENVLYSSGPFDTPAVYN